MHGISGKNVVIYGQHAILKQSSDRQAAVLALLRREEPAQVLARRYGVSEKTLYSWRDVFPAAGQAALTNGRSKGDPRDRTIRELQEQWAIEEAA